MKSGSKPQQEPTLNFPAGYRIDIVPNGFIVQPGTAMMLVHPDDFEKIKKLEKETD